MKNKRGQGLSTSAIILIILGVIILAILAIGFFLGWETIAPWIKPGDNVDTVTKMCEKSCTTMSSYDYCSKERKLIASDLPEKEATGTCKSFAETAGYEKYNFPKCPGLCS